MKKQTAAGKSLPPQEIALFCEQVSMLLGSGIPLHDGMDTLCETYRGTRFGAPFEQMSESVRATGSLHEAMAGTGIFPAYLTRMVDIGERAGKLDDVLSALARYYEREGALRLAVRHAVAYPLMLVALMAAVIAVLVARVLPVFEQVFRSLGTEIGPTASAAIRLGTGLGAAMLILLALVLLAAGTLAALLRTRRRQAVGAWLRAHLPALNALMRKISAGRFAAVMSMLLTGGYPLDEAIALVPGVLADERTRQGVAGMREAMEQGAPFADALEAAGLFAPMHAKMIRVGMAAGQSEQVMEKLSALYDEEVDADIARLVGMIEPSLVALLSIVIGAILLSVMLPLATIMSSLI